MPVGGCGPGGASVDPDGVDDDVDVEGVVVEDGLGKGAAGWGLSNDLVFGDRWKMADVKKRPLDGPMEGLIEMLFCRKKMTCRAL